MAPVLFVAYGGGHVAALAPVYAALLAQGLDARFLALTTARAYLKQRGLPCIGFADCPGAADPRVLAWGEELWQQQVAAGAIDPVNPSVSRPESVAYLGLNFRDLVEQWGEAEAARRFAEQGRQIFAPTRTLRELLLQGGYRAVVATSAPRAEKAAIEAAGQLGLPSLCLVDLFAIQEVRWLKAADYATTVCVLNEAVRRSLVEAGRPASAIAITGNPAFDQLHDQAHSLAACKLADSLGVGPATRCLLWASQVEPVRHPLTGKAGDPTLPARIEKALLTFVQQHPDTLLLIRPHPSEARAAEAEAPWGDRVRFCGQGVAIEALLHLADVVVTMTSTVGVQAALIGKAVAAVTCSVFEDDAPLSRLGLAEPVDRIEDLSPILLKLFTNPGAESVVSPSENGLHRSSAVHAVLDQLARLDASA